MGYKWIPKPDPKRIPKSIPKGSRLWNHFGSKKDYKLDIHFIPKLDFYWIFLGFMVLPGLKLSELALLQSKNNATIM